MEKNKIFMYVSQWAFKLGEDGLLADTGFRGYTKGSGGVSFFDPHE